MLHRFPVPLVLLAVLLAAPVFAGSDADLLHLSLGDPARKAKDVPLVLDAIVDTHTGDALSADDLVDRLAGVSLVLVGESHTSMEAHRVQARLIDLLAQRGRRVLVGLEMFPYTQQRSLDTWNARAVSEPEFVRQSDWYRYWGFPWPYYRDVFLAAQASGARMVALNAPREVVRAVGEKGLANLTPDEAAQIPAKIDVDNPEHLQLFKASFGGGDAVHGAGSNESWKRMLAAQATWDATMAFNAVKALTDTRDDKAVMVVIVGAGHVEYGLGIARQARQWYSGRIASVIPVPVRHTGGGSQSVRASYADFVWGVPSEMFPAFPTLGISTGGRSATTVIDVEAESPAARAGLRHGDVLVSVDGTAVVDDETFNSLMATKRWGDAATLVLSRGGRTLTVRAELRRVMPTMLASRQ